MTRAEHRRRGADDAALRLVQEHAAELLRFARRFSYCADDAHDAYQRTLEILVRRMRSDPPEQLLSWTRTVLRHEALSIRAERRVLVGRAAVDPDRWEGSHLDDPAERIVGRERLDHAAEALQRLKPQEVAALVLRAEGLTYSEICARLGWTYTRCNRAVTEGRRALLERLGAIESGAECARWLPLLSAFADGEATAAELVELRPHLRSCAACRATLRDCHRAPSQVAALVPVTLLPLAAEPAGSLLGHLEVALHGLAERATLLVARMQGGIEAVPAGKLAAVAASTAALAGGGAALQQATDARHAAPRPAAAVAPVSAGGAGLTTLAASLPLPGAPPAGAARRSRRPIVRREFGASPASRSEFAPGTAPAPEFAAGAPQPAAQAAAAPDPAPPATPSPPKPPEFAGP